jgi:single-strand DNA-binding protein
MAGVNKVILLGNIGADPEVRHFDSGSVVANINLATTESYKNKEGERVDNTEWHYLELWDGLAKISEQYLKKGDQIYIEGKIKTDNWQAEDGTNRKTTKIRVVNMTMLKKGSSDSNATNAVSRSPNPAAAAAPSSNGATAVDENELPF